MAGNSPHHDGPPTARPLGRIRRTLAAMLGLAMLATPVATSMSEREAAAAPGDETVIGVTGDFGWNHPGILEDHGELVRGLDPDYVLTTGDNVQTIITEEVPGEDGVRDPLVGTDIYDFTVGRNFCDFLAGAAAGPLCPSGGTSPTNRFFAAAGNHDHMEANGGGPISNYTDYFDLPGAGAAVGPNPSGSELYYDVVMGDVHVFVLDTDPMLLAENHLEDGGTIETLNIAPYGAGVDPRAVQRTWLETALASSDAAWKVVAMHHSPWSSAVPDPRGGYGSTDWLQWPYGSEEWDVDLVLSGHHHAYEQLEIGGVRYVTNGMGGDYPRKDFLEDPVVGSRTIYNEDDEMVVGRLAATDTSLVWEAHNLAGEIVDRFTLGAEAPTAVAAATPLSGVAPLEVTLDGSGSTNPSGGELTYAWDTDGDNVYDDATGVAPTVTFTDPGTHEVRLQVTNGGGISSLSEVVTINVTRNNGPQMTAAPEIAGEAVLDATLTATPGSWSGTTPIETTQQWQRCLPTDGYAQTVAASNPVAHWRLGETSGTEAADVSGNGQTGTYVGDSGDLDLTEPGGLTGDDDTAVLFKGNDGRVERAAVAGMPTTEFSADLWVRTTNTSKAGTLLSYAVAENADEFYLLDPGSLEVSVIGTRIDTGIKVNDGEWHHVAATWTSVGGELRVYVDGALRFSQDDVRDGVPMTAGGTVVLGQDQDVLGGGFGSSQALAGRLDEVAIYPTVLGAAQIEAHHDAGASGIGCTDVAGATGLTYEAQAADLGHSLRVRVVAQNADGTTVVRSARTAVVAESTPPDPIGDLESVSSSLAAKVTVRGWAADPNEPTTATSVDVYVGGDEDAPGTERFTLTANRSRPDVAEANPGFGADHGFEATLTSAKTGTQQVCAYARNLGPGEDQALGCESVAIRPQDPVGAYGAAMSAGPGKVRVRGWMLDWSRPTTPVDVVVVIGGTRGAPGTETHVVKANARREDIGTANPGAGPNHGLDAVIDTAKTGKQTVCVYAKNLGRGEDTAMGCRTTTIVK